MPNKPGPQPVSPARTPITHFASASHFRQWLEANHDKATELWLGFYKKKTRIVGMTYSDALDEALCFGWIDGVRKRVDDQAYTIRFTPRRPRSTWSLVNLRRAKQLLAQGRMAGPGLTAYRARLPEKTGTYSFERAAVTLDPSLEATFRKNASAWKFFNQQPPGYRRIATWWVVNAKKEETRLRRLSILMDDSAAGRRLDLLSPTARARTKTPA